MSVCVCVFVLQFISFITVRHIEPQEGNRRQTKKQVLKLHLVYTIRVRGIKNTSQLIENYFGIKNMYVTKFKRNNLMF